MRFLIIFESIIGILEWFLMMFGLVLWIPYIFIRIVIIYILNKDEKVASKKADQVIKNSAFPHFLYEFYRDWDGETRPYDEFVTDVMTDKE